MQKRNSTQPDSPVEARVRGRTPTLNAALIEEAVRQVGSSAAVTMQGVAKALGVNVTTLYRHTGGLEKLRSIRALQKSREVGEVPSAAGSDWRQWLTQLAKFYRRAFLQNPDLLTYAQGALDPDFRRLERATRILVEFEFEPREAVRAHAFLVNNVVGYVYQELQTELESEGGITPTYTRLAETLQSGSDRLPMLTDLHLDADDLDRDANFNFFIACAIEGIAARIEGAGRK